MYTTCEVFQCHTPKNQFRVNSRDKTSGLYFKPPPHPPSPLPLHLFIHFGSRCVQYCVQVDVIM